MMLTARLPAAPRVFITRLGLLAALWCGLAAPLVAAAADIVVNPGVASVPVDQGLEVLIEEPGESLTRERVVAPDLAKRWVPYKGKKIHLQRKMKPVWIRFHVSYQAEADARWLLGIDWPLLKHIDFHQLDPASGRWVSEGRAGMARPDADLAFKDPAPMFRLALQPGQRATVLLRVQSDTQMSVPLTLWSEKAFQAFRYDHGMLMGLLFGILSVMLLYNLSLYAFTRERSFLSYSAYLLAIVLFELAITGYGPLYVWRGSDWLLAHGYEFFACLSFLTATTFFRHFLRLKRAGPFLNRSNQFFVAFWSVLCVMAMLPSSELLAALAGVGGISSSLLGLGVSLYLVAKGNVLARYFTLAWASVIVATVLALLALVGAVEGGWWVIYAQHMGFVIETLLLSVALAERIKRERASKEAAQRNAQMYARKVEHEREEKIRAQEHALALQRHANEELELRVLDRTAELERAMKNVELANIELAKLSVTDALTKVHNRRYFDDTLKKEHDRSARTGVPLAVLMADIDHFKTINDTAGHLAGDECLKLVAAALATTVGRSTDLVARYGGEEFAIVLPATGPEQALEVAERVRAAVEGIEFIYRGKRVPVSISLGVVARVAQANQPITEFLAEADAALYEAKHAGRNRVQLAAA